ncbi:hypothetical protein [Streptomyces sp. NPDC053755]|uniref:hypothetical protein n=1 Tax=Streptomyces sp. NPDC053755 TaxID=3155815 RepID=UPI003442B1CF
MYFDENEPQGVRDRRLAAERAERAHRRRSASVDLRAAHAGLVIVAVAVAALVWFGECVALGVVSGVFLLWFCLALTWVHVDGDRGLHAFQRAYSAVFGWAGSL